MREVEESYEFGDFRLDIGEHKLLRLDGPTHGSIPEKAFQTLVQLVRNSGTLLTKHELLEAVWPDVVVEENNLVKAIYAIRRFLDDLTDDHKYIETIPKHGYRFVADVKRNEPRRNLNGNGVHAGGPRSSVGSPAYELYLRGSVKVGNDAPHNLPTPLTELIGRCVELSELKTLLQKKTVRLATLTGTGGTGKTRLGLQVAREMLGEFADGVFFVQLAPVRDPDLVPSTIAKTLKIEESGRPTLDDLKLFLRDRHTLIILDNFEQLLDAAPLVADLLESCPYVKVLATSRVPLHLRGEYDYPVVPLSLPHGENVTLAEALQSVAVRLFVERGVQANFRFEITEDNARAIVDICRRLDGLPLAIELAAVRTRTLTAEKILERLANRLQLLCGGARDLPARQQTMRDAIAWSYDLLTEGERSLFRRLSIFAGSFSVEAAGHVADQQEQNPRHGPKKKNASGVGSATHASSVPSFRIDVLDGITSLTDKGLLVSSHDPDEEPRFRMLEVVREFALECLDAIDEADDVRRRHAEYYAALAEKAKPHLLSSNAGRWLDSLERDHANLRSAMRWLFENDPVRAAHLAAAIGEYFRAHYHLAEGREWLEKALALNIELAPAERIGMLFNLGLIAVYCGDYEAARAAFEENLSEAKMIADKGRIADSLRGLGGAVRAQCDYVAAREFFDEALVIYREIDHKEGIANSLLALGVVMFDQRHIETSRILSEESLMTFRTIGHKRGICTSLINLGEFAWLQKDSKSAQKFFAEALTIAGTEDYRDRLRLSFCLDGFAALAVLQEDWKRAVQLAGAAEKLRETIGVRREPQDDDFRNTYIKRPLSVLDAESFSGAYEEGRRMKIEDAVALASETYKLERIH